MNMLRQSAIAPVRVAVIIPVFRHSVLLVEAIESALAQDTAFESRIVIVNDGCPHAETDAVARAYATVHGDRVIALKKRNGGLSSARNHGIEFALSRWPELEAIYFLDADNRMRPHLLARAMAALDADPGADWIYPNIDMFGLPWGGDFGGPFSVLVQSAMNACEAGSLVRRRVFEAGLAFDTAMKLGFEDWDFFLSAAEKGFRGKNGGDIGFRYRKRPESMLADSHRDAPAIKGYMLQKHPWLRDPAALVGLEQAEAPRYAIYLADRGTYWLTTDPALPGETLTAEAFIRRLWAARLAPEKAHSPGFLVATESTVIERLRAARILHWALWRLEERAETAPLTSLTLAVGKEDGHCRVADGPDAPSADRSQAPDPTAMLMIAPQCLDAVLRDPRSDWIDGLIRPDQEPVPAETTLTLPRETAGDHNPGGGIAHALLTQIHRLRHAAYARAAGQSWGWRAGGVGERRDAHRIARQPLEGAPSFPKCRGGRPAIGFLLPLVAFGGVEKVALETARAFRAAGWEPHLVVLEAEEAALTAVWRETFETVSFLDDAEQRAWDGEEVYLGTDIPPWARHGDQTRAEALMSWMDVVVNCHGAAAHGLMGRLKRSGVRTVASIHLHDRSGFSRPVGHSYLALAYEHAYDLIAPCSHSLGAWCHAMGAPAEKIVPVPNAPGYPMAPEAVAAALADRAAGRAATPGAPLRILFLGRLDRQKGLHHLGEIIDRAAAAGIAVDWRVVGRAVLDRDAALPGRLADVLEPPVSTPEALSALYSWADLLILPSAFEGLPLTVLEAMRLGVVPVATDVGAVAEIVRDDETGCLLPPGPGLTDVALGAIGRLAGDRDALARLSAAGAAAVEGRRWEHATAALRDRLETMLRPRPAPETRPTPRFEKGGTQ